MEDYREGGLIPGLRYDMAPFLGWDAGGIGNIIPVSY